MDSKRVANQAVFRSVNERISDLNEDFSVQLGLDAQFVCECPDMGCIEPISMATAEYRRIRENATWFIVVAGHIDTELEDVIETHETFTVVAVPERLFPDRAEDEQVRAAVNGAQGSLLNSGPPDGTPQQWSRSQTPL